MNDNDTDRDDPSAADGLRLMRLFMQLPTEADREEAIRLIEALVKSVQDRK